MTGGEHVEVRVTGPRAAVDAVLRLLRTASPDTGVTGGGARGPYERGDGAVAFYAHLQVDVARPGPPPLPAAAGEERGGIR